MKPLMVAAPAEATDDQLVAAAQQGSDAAFEVLFRRYRGRIAAYVRGIVSDHARAEDIVQDVFMSALRSMRATEREIAFKPWVYEIARNACIDHIRRARRASEVSIDSEDFSPVDEGRLSAGVESTDAAYSAREQFDALRMAFHDLPDAQREVLVSREFEGLSYDTISSRTGLSRSAVESMLFRARRTLKDGFDDIATGERCQRMRSVMSAFTDGGIGLRQERRLTRHLSDCAACRREAIALGLDDLALGAARPARTALSRLAGLIPLPAFIRRRWFDGAGLAGSAGPGTAEEGMSLAGKAAAVLAAAALAGGGAGVAHKAGQIGGGEKAAPAPAAGKVSSKDGSAPAPSRHARDEGRAGRRSPGGDAEATAPRPGKGSSGGGGPAAAGASRPAASGVGGTIQGTANGARGTLDQTTKSAGGTVGGTVDGVGETLDNTLGGVGGTAGGTVGGTLDTTKGTVDGVTGTAGEVVGSLTAPTQQPAPTTSLPRVPTLTP